MKYYELIDHYRRDMNFVFDEDKSVNLGYFDLSKGIPIEHNDLVYYKVDKIDSYLDKYDLLPTLGPILVSQRFKNIFSYLEGSELQFFNSVIVDNKGNEVNNFYALNIMNSIDCLDLDRSIIETTSYGTTRIKKFFLKHNSLGDFSIVRMNEHKSYVIVKDHFKQMCKSEKLKGLLFIEEGDSIYTKS